MKEAPDQLIRRHAEACADLTTEARLEYLERECAGDDDLRREVEARIREQSELQKTQTLSSDYENVLPNHYRLIELLGRGGMAEVFLAEDTRLGRRVAIKFLNSEFRKDPDRMRRFHQEARAASALNHPNILTIHDIGEKEGVQYLVSEFVQGEALSSTISRGKVPLLEAVDIAIQIASALAASHNAGIVHRDIKPDNVMLRPDGSVKVLDFGLAKDTGSFSGGVDGDAYTLANVSTSPGLILGTPQYMSPEQARGKKLDSRTDIFSLGIIIFEMVTGLPPFRGNSMADTIAAILTQEPRRLEEYLNNPPVTLIRIVEKALRKDREERYSNMEHLVSDLKDLRRELVAEPSYDGRETGGTRPIATRRNTVRTVGEKLVHFDLLWVLVLPLALVAGIIWWYFGGANQDAIAVTGSMRSVGITSWSSRPGEIIPSASFSPDARMIAYASTQSGATEIWVKPTAGGDAIQVTKDAFDNQYPVWSPNGQDIAFFSKRGGSHGIWRAAFTGGIQAPIITGVGANARPVYWAKSGKIYFQEGPELYATDETASRKTRITTFEAKGIVPRTLEISPDESRIAYSTRESDVWKVKLESLTSDVVTRELGSSKDQIDYLAWHPNGRDVYFSTSADGTYQVFQAGENFPEPVQLSNGGSDFYVQDISADGLKILNGSVSETSDLWMVNTDGAGETLVANDVAAEYWADVSPDGKNIAYQSVIQVDKPFRGSIAITPPDAGGRSMTIASDGFSPVWSNDGQWIAYFRRGENGIEIWRIGSTGADAVRLTENPANAPGYIATPYLKVGTNHCSWSPDSGFVAYSGPVDGRSNILIATSDGSRNQSLTENKEDTDTYCCPVWTRDGETIVFTSDYATRGAGRQMSYRLWRAKFKGSQQELLLESKERFRFIGIDETGINAVIAQKSDPGDLSSTPVATDIYSVSIETGARSKLNTLDHAYFHNIHLSRDGRQLAFVSRRDNTTALWTVPVNGGTPKQLLVENDPKVLISSLAWSPDGRSIVFGKQTRTNLLSMLAR